jgi:hypothetical protein
MPRPRGIDAILNTPSVDGARSESLHRVAPPQILCSMQAGIVRCTARINIQSLELDLRPGLPRRIVKSIIE